MGDGEAAQTFNLDADGLNSRQYVQLGSGPRLQQICDVEEHERFPWPDELWPGGFSDAEQEATAGHPRSFYNRVACCKRCGLSAEVASGFGQYGLRGRHQAPWFCHKCSDAYPGRELLHREGR